MVPGCRLLSYHAWDRAYAVAGASAQPVSPFAVKGFGREPSSRGSMCSYDVSEKFVAVLAIIAKSGAGAWLQKAGEPL